MSARKQCRHCPWKRATDPYDIPNGYSPIDHAALKSTIKEGTGSVVGPLQIMACHETPRGNELPCVGWLANQLGPGNNLALRIAVLGGTVSAAIETDGPQHERFEATLVDGPVAGGDR